MLRYLTLALALVAAAPAYAQQKMRWVTSLPPVEYDKPYSMTGAQKCRSCQHQRESSRPIHRLYA
jgi:hypothetical protein